MGASAPLRAQPCVSRSSVNSGRWRFRCLVRASPASRLRKAARLMLEEVRSHRAGGPGDGHYVRLYARERGFVEGAPRKACRELGVCRSAVSVAGIGPDSASGGVVARRKGRIGTSGTAPDPAESVFKIRFGEPLATPCLPMPSTVTRGVRTGTLSPTRATATDKQIACTDLPSKAQAPAEAATGGEPPSAQTFFRADRAVHHRGGIE